MQDKQANTEPNECVSESTGQRINLIRALYSSPNSVIQCELQQELNMTQMKLTSIRMNISMTIYLWLTWIYM